MQKTKQNTHEPNPVRRILIDLTKMLDCLSVTAPHPTALLKQRKQKGQHMLGQQQPLRGR
jgi:hypothetical protein